MGAPLPARAHLVQIVRDAERKGWVAGLDCLRDFSGPQERTGVQGRERTSPEELCKRVGLAPSLGTEPHPGQASVVDALRIMHFAMAR